VESYDFFTNVSLFSRLENFEPESDDENVSMGGMWSPGENIFGESFNIRGVQNHNIMEVEQGLIQLVDGRLFRPDEMNSISTVAIISREFANLNNLHVGSNMSFRNVILDREAEMRAMEGTVTEDDIFASQSYDIEVIGIFEPLSLPNTNDPWMDLWAAREIYNRIYVPNSFAEIAINFANDAWREVHPEWFEGVEDGEDLMWWENFFTLYDPNDFPAFREGVANIAAPYHRVLDTGSSLRPVLSALDTMRGLTFIILIVAIGASVLILTLLIMLFLRDRRREIGIYLSLGERKSKVLAQFLLEISAVAFFAIVIALFAGNIVASNLSENMLMNDIASEQEAASNMNNMGGMWDPFAHMGFQTDVPTDVIVSSYDVSLSPFVILLFFGMGFGIILLATLVPMVYVLRLNPKKIML
jgi:putative ABC transport system permease protein